MIAFLLFFGKLVRYYGEAGCGGLARNSRAEACARLLEHHRGASSEAPLRDYVVLGGYFKALAIADGAAYDAPVSGGCSEQISHS